MKRLFLSVGLIALATAALAGNEVFNVTFTAGGFSSFPTQAVPVDPVTGEFQISIDPTKTYDTDTSDITFIGAGINLALGSALSFTYAPGGVLGQSDPGELVVGGAFDNPSKIQVNPSTNDFYLQIPNFFTSPSFQQLGYTQTAASSNNNFFTVINPESPGFGSVEVTLVQTGGVPEAPTWAMGLVGFALVGLWGMKRVASASALA